MNRQHQSRDNRNTAVQSRRELVMRMQQDKKRLDEKEAKEKEKQQIAPKPGIGDPDDNHEKEADAVAQKVVHGNDVSDGVVSGNASLTVQLKEEEEGMLMAKSEDGSLQPTGALQTTLESTKGTGQSLDEKTQNEMGPKMNADLSDVKIHTDSRAHEMSEGINAKAFTHGQDIYFRQGNFDTSSNQGKELLAHELAHTQQQKGGVSRKIQRQFDPVKSALGAFAAAQPAGFFANLLLNKFHELPEKDREKLMNKALDEKIQQLHAAEKQGFPSSLKTISDVLSMAPTMMPSLETIWPLVISGEIGYFEYLRNLSNQYVKPDQVVGKQPAATANKNTPAPPAGMVINPDYKKGGYAAVIENALKAMTDPNFMLGEIDGIFNGIGGWFVDIKDMFVDLWGLLSGTLEFAGKAIHTTASMVADLPMIIAKEMLAAKKSVNWLHANSGMLLRFFAHILFTEAGQKEMKGVGAGIKSAIANAANGMAKSAGASVAKVQSDFMAASPFAQGSKIGYIQGYLIPEILLAVLSDGIGTGLKAGVQTFKATRAGIKAAQSIKWLAELGKDALKMLKIFEGMLPAMKKGPYKVLAEAFENVLQFFKRLMGLEEKGAKGLISEGEHVPNKKVTEGTKKEPKHKPIEEKKKPIEEEKKTVEEEKEKGEKKKNEEKNDILDEETKNSLNSIDEFVEDKVKDSITELIKIGEIDENIVEEVVEEIVDQATKKSKKLSWPEVKALFKRGNSFNKKAITKYQFNEVTLTNGKRLDSYIPGKEIISRKATTLSEIKFSTFENYLKELVTKYEKGKAINAPKFGTKFKGKVLEGEYFLEIPESNKSFYKIKEYSNFAKEKYNVTIKYLAE